ncbi:MAG: D-cysteine desulfhydrase family protein, partial [Candidatus Aegiribacteria sp.]
MEGLLGDRVKLARLPTPVQLMERMSRRLGVELFVKRDDLTESVASGNKIRKL